MKKISKKIVSLVTLAAFALTLVPATAFAAAGSVDDTTAEVSVVDYDTAKVTINVGSTDIADGGNIVVWATDSEDAVVPQSEVSYDAVTGTTVQPDYADWEGSVVLLLPETAGEVSLEATFDNAGEYDIHVGLNDSSAPNLAAVTNEVTVTDGAFYAYPAVADASEYGVYENNVFQSEATVAVNTDLTTTFKINNIATDPTDDVLDNVVVWAVNTANGQVSELANVTAVNGLTANGKDNKAYKFTNVANNATVKVQFSAAGEYVLYAGYGTLYSAAKDNKLGDQYTTVTVTDETVVDSMSVKATIENGSSDKNVTLKFDDTNTAVLNLAKEAPDFNYNGVAEIKLNGKALEEDKTPAKGQIINFATTRTDVVEFDNVTDTTDTDGTFSTVFTMQDKKNAVVTITDEATGLEYTIRVIAATNAPADINRTLTDGYVLAGTDTANWTYMNRWFTDAVQFEILDEKGDVVTGDVDATIDVRTQPNAGKDNALTGSDFLLKDSGNGVYTLWYKGDQAKLVPGKYEVRVAINSDDNATVTFTAAKFGKAQDTVLDIYASDHDWSAGNPNEDAMIVDDQITLGQNVLATAKYVDENGIKVVAKDVNYGFNGDAVVDPMPKDGTFSTPADIPANESLLGTEVEVVAYNTAKHQLVTKTLTVVDSYSDKSLEFDPVQGPTNEDNKVTVSVVNEDGKVQQVNGKVSAWVADQSNEDAKVSVDTTKNTVSNGKATLSVYSDQETTADIVVVVKAGTEAYYGTLEYTFGQEDPLADRTVVMTVGSTEYVVNNKIITGDAAPYVDSNWRTMVPIRALAESFDAEVIWNQDDSTVTINFDGDTQIVMTVGETAYTVDGVEAEMDTEPVNTGDRVYVPIRFAAEGLGFGVTPLYDDAGLTASVVFQR